jgi:hypothetical protein
LRDGRTDRDVEADQARALAPLKAAETGVAVIDRVADGGIGLPLKVVQERMGHASVVMTSDVYGHLFPNGDERGNGGGRARPVHLSATRPRHAVYFLCVFNASLRTANPRTRVRFSARPPTFSEP